MPNGKIRVTKNKSSKSTAWRYLAAVVDVLFLTLIGASLGLVFSSIITSILALIFSITFSPLVIGLIIGVPVVITSLLTLNHSLPGIAAKVKKHEPPLKTNSTSLMTSDLSLHRTHNKTASLATSGSVLDFIITSIKNLIDKKQPEVKVILDDMPDVEVISDESEENAAKPHIALSD